MLFCRDCGKQVYLGKNLLLFVFCFFGLISVKKKRCFEVYMDFGISGGFDTAHAAARLDFDFIFILVLGKRSPLLNCLFLVGFFLIAGRMIGRLSSSGELMQI